MLVLRQLCHLPHPQAPWCRQDVLLHVTDLLVLFVVLLEVDGGVPEIVRQVGPGSVEAHAYLRFPVGWLEPG